MTPSSPLQDSTPCILRLRDAKLIPLITDTALTSGRPTYNPSIAQFRGRKYVSVRSSNFILQPRIGTFKGVHKQLKLKEDDHFFYSETFILELDAENRILDCSPLVFDENVPQWIFAGLEDVRLVAWDDRLFALGNRRDHNPLGESRMELYAIAKSKAAGTWRAQSKYPLSPPESYWQKVEKNWSPINERPFQFVRWTFPTELVDLDLTNGCCQMNAIESVSIENYGNLRGGSQVVKLNEKNWISIVHEAIANSDSMGNTSFSYVHRIVNWNEDMTIKEVSRPFNFMGGQVEFCAGLIIERGSLIASIGFEDSSAYLVSFKLDEFIKMGWFN